MTDETPIPAPTEETAFERATRIMRLPFPPEQIGKLPRAIMKDGPKGKCDGTPQSRPFSADGAVCGGYHARSIHLDYVGHAALTMRLLDADPAWSWEPVAVDQSGLPLIMNGGLWIRLTVAGVTRLGYGDAPGKRDATKELIGDALRNAAMRFGAATDLWSKEDLRTAEIERGEHDEQTGASAATGEQVAPAARGGANAAQTGAPAQSGAIDEDVRSVWRQRVLQIEYLGNKPKEAGPDGGLRTAYVDATKAGVLAWAVDPRKDETFLQLFGRLSRELPERPNESGDDVPGDETPEQRTEREIAEREREEIRRHEADQGLGRATDDGTPAVLGNGWQDEPTAGWATSGNGHTR